MANGNNGNTEDTVNRQEQEQQQQHSDLTGGGGGGVVREGGGGGGIEGGGSELAADLVGGGGDGQIKLDNDALTSSHGGVNDLVADLCLKSGVIGGGYSSYMDNRACTSSSSSSVGGGAAPPSSFSFKHFLNSSGTVTAPSSTVTSVDTAVQTSTGARPKVPQSVSASYMQGTPENGGSGGGGGGGASSASSKMKRSPRFSSFDSQASLAEYAACGSGPGITGSRIQRPDLRLHQNEDFDSDHVALSQVRNTRLYDERLGDDDIFPSAASNLQTSSSGHTRYVPRSYSSYDTACSSSSTSIGSSSSPRRRPLSGNRDLRPNRLVLAAPPPKLKLDLPLDMAKTSTASGSSNGGGGLPDFVQDHLPDGAPTWCSPPNSPLGAAEAPLDRAIGALSLPSAAQSCSSLPAPPIEAPYSLFTAALPVSSSSELGTGSTVKMLPDFLADGPILHSSQRLADVAIGLPFNSMDSPPPLLQQQQQQQQQEATAALRLENERLQRELQELRVELQSQSRRAQDSEQQLFQLVEAQRRREAMASSANAQTTQRLRRQVVQLEAELLSIRASGGVNRSSSDGAVGGTASLDGVGGESILNTPGGGSISNSGASSSTTTTTTRPPSRTHQLSRDLLRAADNAEQNLRQLLVGVDNLRQMAANLEQQPGSTSTPRSPDPYTDFN
uniref:GK20567 n=1 Tax=Drosophila willistoni TaxID=7260 RepID=B4N5F9_DROWI